MGIILVILKIIGIIIGAYVVFMFIMALGPRKPVPKQRIERTKHVNNESDKNRPGPSRKVNFEVKGTPLSAWFYLPEDLSSQVPCIIMAHGMGATKAVGLDAYAQRFQAVGFAVFAFDFRYLGDSAGEPRQLVWIPYQQQDFSAAVEYLRGLKEIDSSRIALWGTSLSGGHVIVTAARDEKITCVCAQVPLLDGHAGGWPVVKKLGFGYMLKMAFGHGLRDLVRSWFRLSPHKIPLVGEPGSIAAMADSGVVALIKELAPDDFVNEICARILLRVDKYHPIKYISKVNCPVLIQAAEKDISLPLRIAEKARKLGKFTEVISYPIDHFDIYLGENFEKAVSDQIEFFRKHLI